MKTYLPYSLILAAAASGMAFAAETAYTIPVGYATNTLQPNRFNLLGLTLQKATVTAGILDSASATSVTDAGVNFTTTLTAGNQYVLELTNGAGNGTVQLISSWTANTLNTPDNISLSVVANVTTYRIRGVATVSDIFGATNSAGLTASTDGDFTIVDRILILNDAGSFDTVYYFNDGAGSQGWFDVNGNPAQNKAIIYPDGFYVQRVAGAVLSLVVSGEVKTTQTKGVLTPGFNYLSSVAPVGLTLGTSGLQNSISQSSDGDFSIVDNVLIPLPTGAFRTTYYFNDGLGTQGWFDADGLSVDSLEITPGFLVQNRGATKSVTVGVPAFYSTL